jgi:UDP-glucose 4-epimerase
MPGVNIQVNENCIGCGTCIKSCFVSAIEIVNDKAFISEDCRGCGRCVNICPQNAIDLTIEDVDYVKKSIVEIDKIIDVA